MGTATATWTFDSNSQSWSGQGAASGQSLTWVSTGGDTTPGCLSNSLTGPSGSGYWLLQGSWNSLFGLPSTAVVTQVGGGSGDQHAWYCSTFSNAAASTEGPFTFCDGSGALQGTFSTGMGYSAASAIWSVVPAGAIAVPVALQNGTSTVQFRLNASLATSALNATSRPTAFAATTGAGYANPTNAYDGNTSTYSEGNASSPNNTSGSVTLAEVWKTFSTVSGSPSSLVLKVTSQVFALSNNAFARIEYSLDSGTSWTTIYSATATRATTTDQVTLPANQNLAAVQVRCTASATTTVQNVGGRLIYTPSHSDHFIYEISIAATANGTNTLLFDDVQLTVTYTASGTASPSGVTAATAVNAPTGTGAAIATPTGVTAATAIGTATSQTLQASLQVSSLFGF